MSFVNSVNRQQAVGTPPNKRAPERTTLLVIQPGARGPASQPLFVRVTSAVLAGSSRQALGWNLRYYLHRLHCELVLRHEATRLLDPCCLQGFRFRARSSRCKLKKGVGSKGSATRNNRNTGAQQYTGIHNFQQVKLCRLKAPEGCQIFRAIPWQVNRPVVRKICLKGMPQPMPCG